jgi:hypothetical protein
MKQVLAALAVIAAMAVASASACTVYIGGPGAISTDDVYGDEGLLSGGETATAIFDLSLSGSTLTLTVTNTSPAVLGTEAPVIPDAPVISDMFFQVPSAVTGMTYLTGGGVAAAISGWDFVYSPNNTPSSGFGFLQKVFDAGLNGGPGPGSPDPVISSIYDPNIFDGPGNPLASPVDFTFSLAFPGGSEPAGFSTDWFCDLTILGDPVYLAAAKFMSGANGGSATVTDPPPVTVPEPAAIVSLCAGLLVLGGHRLRRKS